MRVRTLTLADPEMDAFVGEVGAVLNAGLGLDQVRRVSLTWTGVPVMVDVGLREAPGAVLVLSAYDVIDGVTRSGIGCTWRWTSRGLDVRDVGGLTTRHDVTLAIVTREGS